MYNFLSQNVLIFPIHKLKRIETFSRYLEISLVYGVLAHLDSKIRKHFETI